MATQLKLETEIEGLGQVYHTENNLIDGLESLRQVGIENPISVRDLAFARIKTGFGNSLSSTESYTSSSLEYAKGRPALLVRLSPLLTNPELLKKAMDGIRSGYHYGILQESIDLYLEHFEQAKQDKNKQPEDRRVLILYEEELPEGCSIRINEFTDIGRFLFQDVGRDYYRFTSQGVSKLHLLGREKSDHLHLTSIIADTLIFHSCGYGSNSLLDGAGGRIARDQYGIRGVRKS